MEIAFLCVPLDPEPPEVTVLSVPFGREESTLNLVLGDLSSSCCHRVTVGELSPLSLSAKFPFLKVRVDLIYL